MYISITGCAERSEGRRSKERLDKLTLDISKAMREYLDGVGYVSRRQKRDVDDDLDTCVKTGAGVGGAMVAATAVAPNPVTAFFAAMAGLVAGTCALTKHVDGRSPSLNPGMIIGP
ncbi:hypothetical protein AAG570_006757 [Ranatra chinensis]|uniref:Uncharacterized protein n=1 Tax=Ranatra chinensis TaxID=642074 RepID=A0ABD0YV94_9HEMI